MVLRLYLSLPILLLTFTGCATIRKFNPVEARTLEARQLTQQAQSAMHRSDWENAESKLVSAIRMCPEDHQARACLANVLEEKGAKEAAFEQLNKSVELSGQRDPWSLNSLGRMQLELGNPREALRFADEAIAIDSNSAASWALRGDALRQEGRTQDSLMAFYRSLSIDSENPGTRLEIAKIYSEQGKPDRALAMLDPVKPIDPDRQCPILAGTCLERAKLLHQLNRRADAMVALQSASRHGMASPDLDRLIVAFETDGRPIAAGKEAEQRLAASKWNGRGETQAREPVSPWR